MEYTGTANPASSWPPDVAMAFGKRLAKFWSEKGISERYENADNFREARIGNVAEEEAFAKAKQAGCCGDEEFEWDLETTPPIRIRYGFNYGH